MKHIELIITGLLFISYIWIVIDRLLKPRRFRALINAEGEYQLQIQSIWGPWWCSELFRYSDDSIEPDRTNGVIIKSDKRYINNILKDYNSYVNRKYNSKKIVKIIPIEYVIED